MLSCVTATASVLPPVRNEDSKLVALGHGGSDANASLLRDHGGVAVIMPVTNMIENRGHFASDEAAIKLLWLALRNINDGQGTISA
jgi:hypothetical protein